MYKESLTATTRLKNNMLLTVCHLVYLCCFIVNNIVSAEYLMLLLDFVNQGHSHHAFLTLAKFNTLTLCCNLMLENSGQPEFPRRIISPPHLPKVRFPPFFRSCSQPTFSLYFHYFFQAPEKV